MDECPICKNREKRFFGIDKKGDLYCRKCIGFRGEKASIKRIKKENNIEISAKLDYPLTNEQEKISNQVLRAFKSHKDVLIYAVCGAGKTELVYKTIAYCLNNGLQVGFTIPRKDVVIELENRIRKTFSQVKVISIYQNHHFDLYGDIILLTTHQLYRYKNYFDLLVFDEVDAFPYKNNLMLKEFFLKSVKGNYIMMSATSSQDLIDEHTNRGGVIFSLMKRYHNHPLIVPKIVIFPFFKEVYLIYKLRKYLKNNFPVLVFAPTLEKVEKIFKDIKPFFKKGNYVHSKRSNRDLIVKKFKEGEYLFLITSSVLERGITIKNLQVIVFEAENQIFDNSTLIQISGRVGRKIDAWDGEVIYLCSYVNEEIKKSIQKIQEANSYENYM